MSAVRRLRKQPKVAVITNDDVLLVLSEVAVLSVHIALSQCASYL